MSDFAYILRCAKKIKAINYLGGKCQRCGNGNVFALTFHHHNKNKKYAIASLLASPWERILKEVKKCSLLCFNCHQELHFPRSSEIKDKILKIKRQHKCCSCGYSGKSNSSLSLHHVGKNDKEKTIGELCNYTENRFNATISTIKSELNKCVVVCENCHQSLYHTNKNRFKKFEKKIREKIRFLDNFIKRRSPKKVYNKLDGKKMEKLCRSGLTYLEISKEFGCNISTVKRYLKRKHIALKSRNKKILNTKKTALKLWKDGNKIEDISKVVRCHWCQVYRFLKNNKDVIKHRLKKQQDAKKKANLIVDLYKKGFTTREISPFVNLSAVHVGRILRNNNVAMRSSGVGNYCDE